MSGMNKLRISAASAVAYQVQKWQTKATPFTVESLTRYWSRLDAIVFSAQTPDELVAELDNQVHVYTREISLKAELHTIARLRVAHYVLLHVLRERAIPAEAHS